MRQRGEVAGGRLHRLGHRAVDRDPFECGVRLQKGLHLYLVFVRLDRARAVDEPPARADERGRRREEFRLQLREFVQVGLAALPPEVGPLREDAEPGARHVEQHPVGRRQVVATGEIAGIRCLCVDDVGEVVSARRLLDESQASLVDIERVERARAHPLRRVDSLSAGRGAQVEYGLIRLRVEAPDDQRRALVLHRHQAPVEQVAADDGLQALDAEHVVEVRRGRPRHVVLVEPVGDGADGCPPGVDAKPEHRAAIIPRKERGRIRLSIAREPAAHHPRGMGVPDREVLGRIAGAGLWEAVLLAEDGSQDPVRQPSRTGANALLCEFDVLVDGRVGRRVLIEDFVEPEAKDELEGQLHVAEVSVVEVRQHEIEAPSPARRPRDELPGLPTLSRIVRTGAEILCLQAPDERIRRRHPLQMFKRQTARRRDHCGGGMREEVWGMREAEPL